MAEKVLKSFSEEEKKKITEIQSKVLAITSRLGEIQLSYLSFEESMKSLQEERQGLVESYKELVNEENELAKVLREKYGDGTYDVQTNTFTPNK